MTDAERKLKLTRFLREENAMNRMKMRNREEILYGTGKTNAKNEGMPLVYEGYLDDGIYNSQQPGSVRSTLGLRMVLAVFLMGAVIYMDKSGAMLGGEPVREVLSAQMSINLEERFAEIINKFNGG